MAEDGSTDTAAGVPAGSIAGAASDPGRDAGGHAADGSRSGGAAGLARGLAGGAPLGLAGRAVGLREITDAALVTIVTAERGARARLERAFDAPLPTLGLSCVTPAGERLLGLQHDRLYVLFARPRDDADPERVLRERLGEDGRALCLNDQSDARVTLRLDGAATRRALERVCPLDLHPDVFPVGAVARTLVEHLSAIVLREDENVYTLLSPRSSARDFLHQIATSIRHVGGAPAA